MISIVETKDYKIISKLNEEVQNLHARLHPEVFKAYNNEAIELEFKNFLSDPNCKCFLAKNDESAIGYIFCFIRAINENAFHYSFKTIYIDQLTVLEKYRRSGVGKLLLEQVEHLAKEHSIEKIELDHWSSNDVAARYFRKNGYQLYKERLFKLI